MAPRFGATKFRNAVPSIPARDGWYRTNLPGSGDTPSNTSQFTSVIKTNREHIVTLAPSGEASIRRYDATGDSEAQAWSGRLAGAGDWDLSAPEDGGLVLAGSDGSVSYYALTEDAPEQRYSFQAPAKVTNIALHPTTPGLALASSTALPVAIYDIGAGASEPAITLTSPEGALWTVNWSPDGRLVGGISKKGSALVWDARAGADAVQKSTVSMQPLKPARLAWVGDDLFVTSFSRTRSRQYSLLSAANGLSMTFTASVDNSQGPLVPIVDQERRIVYAAGRGDMMLRQIELSGPMGYQEAPHSLPSQLTSGSLALCHWHTLPVMEAQIATVLVPTQDKDGDTILPLHIKVPRRQLIDYHDDLYPDVTGTVPEQTAEEWLSGSDNKPLPISLDPTRRGEWQKGLDQYKQRSPAAPAAKGTAPEAKVETIPEPAVKPVASLATAAVVAPTAPEASPAATPAPSTPKADEPALASTAKVETASPVEDKKDSASRITTSNPDLPPLEGDETYSSTAYKVRYISNRIVEFRDAHVRKGAKGPLMVGIQGPQGCGKTTLCDALLDYLRSKPIGMSVAVLSLDDLYHTNEGLKKVAKDHPESKLLQGRGPPGTHDVELGEKILKAVKAINDNDGGHVELPIFDKSLCDGEGDRSDKTVPIDGPLDVFILEGWSMGFGPLSTADLEARYAAKDGTYFPQHSLESLTQLNTYLAKVESTLYPFFSAFVQVEPTSYEYVFKWRLQQEHNMKAKNGGRGMTDDQVHKFIERYMPGYELWKDGIYDANMPWAGRVVRMVYGPDREVLEFDTPEPKEKPAAASALPKVAGAVAAVVAAPVAAVVVPATAAATVIAETAKKVTKTETPKAELPKVDSSKLAVSDAAAPPNAASPAPAASTPAPVVTKPAGERYNPNWSRKYLGGKSPLNPTYDQIPSVATLHQDSLILHVTPHLALFPIQGSGGRLYVHPLSKKGRVPVGGLGYLSGGVPLVDFAADPFDGSKVVLAGEDGIMRVWEAPNEGYEGPGPEPAMSVRGDKVDKIAHLAFHPTAKDLLVAATNDLGKASLRFFDLAEGKESLVVPLGVAGAFNFAISPYGDRIAVATKDAKIIVLDPRDPDAAIAGKTDYSLRSFQLDWVDRNHIVSIGFARGSMRKVTLHEITPNEIKTKATLTIDVSPGVLFPVFDADTGILYVWGKGELSIQAFEVQPEGTEPLAKLPVFHAANGSPQLAVAFRRKTENDVRKVEVARALRLTARTVEEVSFTIPRNKPQFFQDDIYLPTIDTSKPVCSAAAWLAGDKTPPGYIELRPQEMTPLSEAPQTATAARKKFVPAADVMSEEAKKKKEMDALFQKAKGLDSSDDEDDEPKRGGIPAPDDDWD